MYFIPKGSRLYRWAVTKNPLMRYCLTFGSTVLFLGGWYFGVYARCVGALDQREYHIAQVHKQCSSIGESKVVCDVLQGGIDACNMRLNAACAQQEKENNYFVFVLEQARKNQVTLGSYAVNKSIDKGWYARDIAGCSFSGDLQNIITFLASLKNNSRMIQCKKMALKSSDDRYELSCELQFTRLKKG